MQLVSICMLNVGCLFGSFILLHWLLTLWSSVVFCFVFGSITCLRHEKFLVFKLLELNIFSFIQSLSFHFSFHFPLHLVSFNLHFFPIYFSSCFTISLFSCVFVSLEEVALQLIRHLADCHLTMLRSFKYPGSPLGAVVFSVSSDCFRARTVSTGSVVLWQPVGQPCGVTLLFVMGLHASYFLCGAVLTETSTECPPALGHIPTQELAEVGLENQIDNRVIKGGGLGKDSCPGKSHWGYSRWVTKCCPHGHDGIWTPCCQETDANCHRQLKSDTNTYRIHALCKHV